MTDRQNFNAYSGDTSAPLIRKGGDKPWAPRGVKTDALSIKDYQELEPIGTYASTVPFNARFELERTGDFPGILYLECDLTITAGTNPTYTRFVDWVGLRLFDSIVVKSGTDRMYRIHGDVVFDFIHKYKDNFDQEQWKEWLHGDLSAAERNTEAASGATVKVTIPLKTHWFEEPCKAPALRALQDKLVIQLESVSSSVAIVQTDASTNATVNVSNLKIRTDFRQLTKSDRDMAVARINARGGGRIHLIPDTQQLASVAITSGATSAQIELDSFSFPAYRMIVFIRTASDLTTDNARDYYNFDYAMLDDLEFELKQGNLDILSRRPAKFSEQREHQEKFAGKRGPPYLSYTWAEQPLMLNSQTGFQPFDTLRRPRLNLYKSGGFSADMTVDVYILTHNFVIEKGTRIHAVLT